MCIYLLEIVTVGFLLLLYPFVIIFIIDYQLTVILKLCKNAFC